MGSAKESKIAISPDNELEFFTPIGKKYSKTMLKLTNTDDVNHAAFKVKTTSPKVMFRKSRPRIRAKRGTPRSDLCARAPRSVRKVRIRNHPPSFAQRYCVRPSCGVIAPGDSVMVEVSDALPAKRCNKLFSTLIPGPPPSLLRQSTVPRTPRNYQFVYPRKACRVAAQPLAFGPVFIRIGPERLRSTRSVLPLS